MLQAVTYACMTCRIAQKRSGHCPHGHDMVRMGTRWRAPKRNNIKAWKRVASGDRLWDDRAKQRSAGLKERKQDKAYAKWLKACEIKRKLIDRMLDIRRQDS